MQYYNQIEHTDVQTQGSTEPVTVQEVKNYLRINSVDESDSSDLTTEDDLIEELITTAREELEVFTGLSLIGKTLEVTLTNLCGSIEIPGPVVDVSDITALDRYGNDITTELKFRGKDFPTLECPVAEHMVLSYDVGFTTIPSSLKLEIMRRVTWLWMYRGDDNGPEFKWSISSKYVRTGWLQ